MRVDDRIGKIVIVLAFGALHPIEGASEITAPSFKQADKGRRGAVHPNVHEQTSALGIGGTTFRSRHQMRQTGRKTLAFPIGLMNGPKLYFGLPYASLAF